MWILQLEHTLFSFPEALRDPVTILEIHDSDTEQKLEIKMSTEEEVVLRETAGGQKFRQHPATGSFCGRPRAKISLF